MQGLGSLGASWYDFLIKRPKSWYTNLNYIQNVLVGQGAEINAIGESAWNQAAAANPKMIPQFKPQIADQEWRLKQIIVRKNYAPTAASIKLASDGTKIYRTRINLVKKVNPPAVAIAATTAGRAMFAKLSKSKLDSPAAVGASTFIKQMEERGKALVTPSGWPWYVWAGIGLTGLVGVGYVVRSFRPVR